MALSLTCACGARFEVAETFAGQSVRCPECQESLKVPSPTRVPRRTSGYALASVVLALVGLFTVVFTALAVLLGLVALVSIGRNRQRVTGVGYAVFGIVVGLVFTGLTLFAMTRDELFDQFREQMAPMQADFSGPLEVIRADDGYAITRPSAKWGVAWDAGDQGGLDKGLILVNVGKEANLQVTVEAARRGESLDNCRERVLANLRDAPRFLILNGKEMPLRVSGFTVRESRPLPPTNGLESLEALVDLRLSGKPFTYLVRLCKRARDDRVYVLSGWGRQRRYGQIEPEIRKAQDSFRLLK